MSARDLLDPVVLFADDPHPDDCCDCCAEYCPQAEVGGFDPRIRRLYTFDKHGRTYIGTPYLMVRTDRLRPMPEHAPEPFALTAAQAWATIPDEPPASLDDRCSAVHWDRIDRSGLTLRGDDEKVRHLYADTEHVGWSTAGGTHPSVIRRGDLPDVRRIADALGIARGTITDADIAAVPGRGGDR